MLPIDEALARLRSNSTPDLAGIQGPLSEEFGSTGVGFAAVGGPLEGRWHTAVSELAGCVGSLAGSPPVLLEGGNYPGNWLESTGTISAEVLSRFAPRIASDSFRLFAEHQRGDGLLPYKVTADGPGFSQIQLVTPLARSVWNHHRLHPQPELWLRTMFEAMTRYDAWIARHRHTRGTGAVEAFCTFDTGHDLSPRFWFVPERCHRGDAASFDPDAATLPYLAPDLTANIACQRSYLALIAAELDEDPTPWTEAAQATASALFEHCFDPEDACFYDRDATGRLVRVRSDVVLRVLACEIGDETLFTEALERHLMRTSRFLSHHGFTSIAMDDPRFDGDHTRNSWAGPVNMLTQLRAAHAFEHFARPAELALTAGPLLAALATADRFPQCVDGWSGEAGFTSAYSPALLWFLDTVERHFGIRPVPAGGLVVTSLPPTRSGHAGVGATAYRRVLNGAVLELAADDERAVLHGNGEPVLHFPRGWRVELDRALRPVRVTGLAPRPVSGTLRHRDGAVELTLGPNDVADLDGTRISLRHGAPFVAPRQ